MELLLRNRRSLRINIEDFATKAKTDGDGDIRIQAKCSKGIRKKII
ncbi:hypothetical protein CI610_03638 [invertebrate metagenome]|uniref:Uncharacterized protein n=1 Tax=invertebrate metagenome TaxID=1711999 RepID=A0A2H9T2J8_9ZZZZ